MNKDVRYAYGNYVLITPCRNEARFAHRCIRSVIAQTVRPKLWLIVDDGSSDTTAEIIENYAEDFPWIRLVRRPDRGRRSVGPGVIEAFYYGLDFVDLERFDYLCKFDLDLDIPRRYFEILLERMDADPKLGTCSGKPYFTTPGGRLVSEGCGDEMSVGMTKFYRIDCFKDIGGFVHQVMWDGIDCHTCRMRGWVARSWDEEELRFAHLRPMGSSQVGIWQGRMRHGAGQFFMGTGMLYMTASSVFRMMRRPFLIGGLGMMAGYLKSSLQGQERYDDRDFLTHLRRYQRACLMRGKSRTMARWHRRIRHV
jgi:glycosyltransferase involved in cell wall biosynthesis